MPDLSHTEVQALCKAVHLKIPEPEIIEVTYHLNALLDAIEGIDEPFLEALEPVPIVIPSL